MTSPHCTDHDEDGDQERDQRIAVVGAGYVGLTTSACLASLGHRVVCGDIDEDKVEQLRAGDVRILEPGLAELVRAGLESGRLEFVVGAKAAIAHPGHIPDVVLVCVPTPMSASGAADLAAVETTVAVVREALPDGCALAIKSTVPVGTAARVHSMLGRDDVAVVSNPEFLREGSAVEDFLHPDRIVIGSDDHAAAERVASLYARLNVPLVLTDSVSAEMAKYAANCFLAMKLSYVNSVAEVCERVGADIDAVVESMGLDPRIGQTFLRPGPGWGGPCLPKDVHSFRRSASDLGVDLPLMDAAVAVNARQQHRVVDKVRHAVGGDLAGIRVGLLGLSFKPGTADVRESPALAVAGLLADEGAELTAFDPAVSNTPQQLPELVFSRVTLVDDPYHVAKGAAALVLLTEWPQFQTLNWQRIASLLERHVVIDTRNHLTPETLRGAGITYVGTGKDADPSHSPPSYIARPSQRIKECDDDRRQ
ncbi:UDP-glucose/GDP-mannose dehydrogenase family protein [Kibdelosporangium philippinense]|uniref:UDP-glucose 6-dehydrogenase n=1 Tax=Kibdelosporangium philippinense TaxID=211113 RepID=A0ABS8ZVQ3_9PSEU|nr:UDP-glucose/GDP-mannose dehydrogenase family protein [Kibdelosporangium philippinense]MCE7011783.1 UDP-glucose/GDP-mannose dehydrogenase family protein [Kibdelosporangium philippinense]